MPDPDLEISWGEGQSSRPLDKGGPGSKNNGEGEWYKKNGTRRNYISEFEKRFKTNSVLFEGFKYELKKQKHLLNFSVEIFKGFYYNFY